jgi:hypothetical protein
MSIPVLTLTPSIGLQHSLRRAFVTNLYKDGLRTDRSAEANVTRADGLRTVTAYKGTNNFVLQFDRMMKGAGKTADLLWAFISARLDNINEPFYLYNPTECFPPDPTGTETRGRYLVALKDPSNGQSRSYFKSCLFSSGLEFEEVKEFSV